MINNSNIYDIDGDIIRYIDDTSKFTIEELQSQITKYQKKIQELEEKDKTEEEKFKIQIYNLYIKNLQYYMVTKIPANELQNLINNNEAIKDTSDKVNKAIEELKQEVDEDTVKSQKDPLVDHKESDIKMDEYVQFEEIVE